MTFLLDWRSAGLACTADGNWRARIWRGGLLLLLPVVGWPMVLGYRRLFVERVIDGKVPLLPDWRGNQLLALRHGVGAMAVIHAWYAPMYVWLAVRTTDCMLWHELPWLPAAVAVLAFPIFSPLVVPVWVMWLRFGSGGAVPQLELLLAGLAFAVVTFLIPAGFLNVARTRRLVTAFDVPSSLRQILARPRAYVEAWIGSGIMSLVAHFCLPLAPWAVVWAYLAIIYGFTELLEQKDPSAESRSWYRYMQSQHWQRYVAKRNGFIERYELAQELDATSGSSERRFRALCLGPLRLPLPGS